MTVLAEFAVGQDDRHCRVLATVEFDRSTFVDVEMLRQPLAQLVGVRDGVGNDATTVALSTRLGRTDHGPTHGREAPTAPSLVHGGVTLDVLDEAWAWACNAVENSSGDGRDDPTFHRAVRVGGLYRVVARVADHVDRVMGTSATIVDRSGELRAE